MQFKKVDVLITEDLTKEELKNKILAELNKVASKTNFSICYIANIHDVVKGKYWICVDSETKETLNMQDELIDLQAIFKHIADNPDLVSRDLLYSSEYIENNFNRISVFSDFRDLTNTEISNIKRLINVNESDIEAKHSTLAERVDNLEEFSERTSSSLEEHINLYNTFKTNTEANTESLGDRLSEKANLNGSEAQVFKVAGPTNPYHSVNLSFLESYVAETIRNTQIEQLSNVETVSPEQTNYLGYDASLGKWINRNIDFGSYCYSKEETDNKFYPREYIDNTFYSKDYVNNTFYTKDYVNNTFYNKLDVDTKTNKKLVEFINVATDAAQFNQLKQNVTLESVFNIWDRVGYEVVNGKLTANTDRVLTELKGWSFNAGDNSINCHTNSAGYLYFISKIAKSSFSATIRVSDYNNSGDNDPVMLCVGDVTIDDKPFNLSFVRNKNAAGAAWVLAINQCNWSIKDSVYLGCMLTLDKSKNDIVLAYPNQNSSWASYPCVLKFERNGKTIRAWTSRPGESNIQANSLIEYTLPTSKPSNMPDDMWIALNSILGSPCVYGFGCNSQPAKFQVIEQTNFLTDEIYNNVDSKTYYYNGSTWVAKTSEPVKIPDNTIISNPFTKDLFYSYNNTLTKIGRA